jgi:hypothetical protein
MRRFSTLLLASALMACGGADYADDTEEMTAGIALADVAGTWNITGTLATGEEPTVVNYTVLATDNEYGWTSSLPNRDPVDVRVLAVEGDSIVVEVGPFESVLRKGVMVTTRSVIRHHDGMLVGSVVATYDLDPVETVAGTFEGTRAEEM